MGGSIFIAMLAAVFLWWFSTSAILLANLEAAKLEAVKLDAYWSKMRLPETEALGLADQKFDFSLKRWYSISVKSFWQIGDGIKYIAG